MVNKISQGNKTGQSQVFEMPKVSVKQVSGKEIIDEYQSLKRMLKSLPAEKEMRISGSECMKKASAKVITPLDDDPETKDVIEVFGEFESEPPRSGNLYDYAGIGYESATIRFEDKDGYLKKEINHVGVSHVPSWLHHADPEVLISTDYTALVDKETGEYIVEKGHIDKG